MVLNWLDFVLIGIIFISALISLFRGFVREAMSLVTWALAIWIALSFAESLAALLPEGIESPTIRLIIGFVVLFVAVLIIGSLIGALLYQLVKSTGISGTDRMLGMLFGAARGVLVLALLVILAKADVLPLEEEDWWQASQVRPYIEPIADYILQILPSDFSIKLPQPNELVPEQSSGQEPASQEPTGQEPASQEPASQQPWGTS